MFGRQTIAKDPISIIPTRFPIEKFAGFWCEGFFAVSTNVATLDFTPFHISTPIVVSTEEAILTETAYHVVTTIVATPPKDLTLEDSFLLGDIAPTLDIKLTDFKGDQITLAPSWYIREPFKRNVYTKYDSFELLDKETDIPHNDLPSLDECISVDWSEFNQLNKETSSDWRDIPKLEDDKEIPWGELSSTDANIEQLYAYPDVKEVYKSQVWDGFIFKHSKDITQVYAHPLANEVFKSINWGGFEILNAIKSLDYSHPEIKDVFKTVWIGANWYPKWCVQIYKPIYGLVEFDFDSTADNATQQVFNPKQPEWTQSIEIVNGDFETGDLTGWSITSGNVKTYSGGVDDNYYVGADSGESMASIESIHYVGNLSLTDEYDYTLNASVWFKNRDVDSDTSRMLVELIDADGVPITSLDTGDKDVTNWTQFSVSSIFRRDVHLIRTTLEFKKTEYDYINSYADNIELNLTRKIKQLHQEIPNDPYPDVNNREKSYPSGSTFGSLPLTKVFNDVWMKSFGSVNMTSTQSLLSNPILFLSKSEDLETVCYDGTWNGDKDSVGTPPIPVPTIPFELQEVYLIMNTATLTRVSDSQDIPINSASTSIDIDSWTWSFSAEVINKVTLDLVKPQADGTLTEVELDINGYKWRFLIEGYGESASFGKRGYSISGRSLSVELASPYSEIKSYIQTSSSTVSQEANEAIKNVVGWNSGSAVEIHADGLDPFLSERSFSYTDKSCIESIASLANSMGYSIIPQTDGRKLTLTPRYKVAPWNLNSITPDKTLDIDFVTSLSASWKPTPRYNGIYVSGTTDSGELVEVIRQDTSGSPYLQMITDPLVTSEDVGKERGRMELSKTGRKEDISISMPILPNQEAPGILFPSNIIQFNDSTNGDWRCHVMSVNITVARAGNVIQARQSVKVERHYE